MHASVAKPGIGLDRGSVGAGDRSGGMAQKYTPFGLHVRRPSLIERALEVGVDGPFGRCERLTPSPLARDRLGLPNPIRVNHYDDPRKPR
jgi:hypothetical protein